MKRILARWLAVLCVCTLVFGSGLETYAADVVEDTTVESESRQEENLQEQEEEIDEDKDSDQEATDDQDDDEDISSDSEEESPDQDADVQEIQDDDKDSQDSDASADQKIQNDEQGQKSSEGKKQGVTAKSGEDSMKFTLSQTSMVYNGSDLKPQVTGVKVLKDETWVDLMEDQYIVTYSNNINVGTGSVQVVGAAGTEYEAYSGSLTFQITKAAQTLKVKASKPSLKYSKKGQLTVTGAKGKLTYTSSNKKVLTVGAGGIYKAKTTGKAVITVAAAATDNYKAAKATITITVTGKQFKASNTKIKLSKKKYTYNGKKRKPKVTVTYKGKKLKKNKDYKLKYQNNIDAGKAVVVVTGMGKYSGTRKKKYTIKQAKNTMKVTLSDDSVDINKTASFTVKKAIGKVTYTSSNTKVATVSAKGVITGKSKGACTITVTAAGNKNYKALKKKFKITVGYVSLTNKKCKVSLSATSYVYDGQYKLPDVKVTYDGKKLKLNTDYTVTYKNNRDAGKATVTVKGKGYYINSRNVTFTIKKAAQDSFYVDTRHRSVKLGSTFTVYPSGAIGGVSYKSNYESYITHLGGGKFKALKTTKNYVTITVTAKGNKNYASKSYEIKVSIY